MVVETEPEWDDDERTRMRALVAYESGICKCGFHQDITSNRDNFFRIEERHCTVCATSDRYARVQDATDGAAKKAAGENAPPSSPQRSDGRQTYLRRMTAEEVAQARAERSPTPGAGARRGN